MALSVLVALMMLAVPLASSSNLFVDGGQTNSNGDAPNLGASTGYTIMFQLNADGKSLDQVSETDLDKIIADLNDDVGADTNIDAIAGVTWYKNENSDLVALVMYDKENPSANVHIQTLINALFTASTGKSVIGKGDADAYDLTSWKDVTSTTSNSIYEYKLIDVNNPDNSAVIKSDMTFAAQWQLNTDGFKEIPINVVVDGETKEYYKAYKLSGTNLNQISIDKKKLNEAILDAADLSLLGIVLYGNTPSDFAKYEQVYKDGVITYGNGNEVIDGDDISSNSTLTATYTFDDKKYSKLTVSSAAFEDGKDVVLYINKASANMITYNIVLASLFVGFDKTVDAQTGAISYKHATDLANADVKPILMADANDFDIDMILHNGGYEELLTDDGYLLSGWNDGAELLNSVNFVPSGTTQVTLDAELNGYYVIFMSKGQFEYVYVPFGELSADLATTLDVEGVNHWAYLEYKNSDDSKSYEKLSESSKFTTFTSFTDSIISTFDGFGKTAVASETPKQPVAVIVACFDLAKNTAYAVFDANAMEIKNTGTVNSPANDTLEPYADGNFGNKYVDKIIVSGTASGTTKNIIPLPAVSPVYEDEVVFINYVEYVNTPTTGDSPLDKYSSVPYATSGDNASYFGDAESIKIYNADVVKYKYAVTFYNGSDVVGKFYYNGDLNGSSNDMNAAGFVAFTYNGVSYKASDLNELGDSAPTYNKDRYVAATKAFNNILYPAKDGYKIIQWKDADGKVMLDKIKFTRDNNGKVSDESYEVKFDKISSDMSFYAGFEALPYFIEYINTYESTVTMPPQTAYVDKAIDLYKEAIFVYEGYKLIGWNTSPDGSGTSYDLGASFTLTGEQYEDLKEVVGEEKVFTLYAVWEKQSGSTPGDNTDGGNDNTALYLIAGMLAIIAILAIVGILLMRKK